MPPAARTHPELIRGPGHAGRRIAKFHLRATALTPDMEIDLAHCGRFYNISPVIPALVLAAGRSSRMGCAKAALPIDGDTFISRIVRTFLAAGVDDVVIVVGHEPEAVVAAVSGDLPVRFVENREYDRGQLSSLVAGLAVVDRPGVEAVLITLVDVPLVSDATVRAVIDRYRQTHAPIVRPTAGDRHGHPLLMDRSLFNELRAADPQRGAKPIVRAHASPGGNVEVADEGAFTDIDTIEEYERVVSRSEGC
jgi:molybdenum cofactor cytidylyltransferase